MHLYRVYHKKFSVNSAVKAQFFYFGPLGTPLCIVQHSYVPIQYNIKQKLEKIILKRYRNECAFTLYWDLILMFEKSIR